MKTAGLKIESYQQREIWATLHVPDSIQGPPIVMAHGFLGFKDWAFFPWLAETFTQAGFPTLRFNFSGSGMSQKADGPFENLEAFEKDTLTRQVEDLRSVIQSLANGNLSPYLPAQKELFLWGHSRGGAVCFLAAANSPEVKAIATWATIARVNRYLYETKQSWRKQGFSIFESSRTGQSLQYSTDFLDDAEKWGKKGDVPVFFHRLPMPVLLVHGSEDVSVPPEESESLAAINSNARLAVLAGANHKFNAVHPFTEPPSSLIEAADKTIEFFKNVRK